MNIKIEINKHDLGSSPKRVRSLLLKLNQIDTVKPSDTLEINLNFDKKEANELSTAIIWKRLNEAKDLSCKKNIKYKGGTTEKYFNERHFFDSLTGKKLILQSPTVPINYETFSPIRPTHDANQNSEINKIFAESTNGILDPKNEFEKEVRVHMVECVQNAFDHSESMGTKLAGIICSLDKEKKMLDFCIIDVGQGIRKSFLSNPFLKESYLKLDDCNAIVQATRKNISCNPSGYPNPAYTFSNGGIGLYYLNKFIQMHPTSSMVIVSDKGYYYTEYGGNKEKLAKLTVKWPGTIVYFRIKLGQNKSDTYRALGAAYVEEFDNRDINGTIV